MTAIARILFVFVVAAVGCDQSTTQHRSTHPTPAASSTVAQVCTIAAELQGTPASTVKPTTSLADLGADELDVVELVMELEDHFNISIPDDAIADVTGNDNWQTSIGKLTMSRLAEIVDEQNR